VFWIPWKSEAARMDCEAKREHFSSWSEFALWRADCLHNSLPPVMIATPVEIEAACFEIRAGWDRGTERERSGCFASESVEVMRGELVA
jgi:hypothetical protein